MFVKGSRGNLEQKIADEDKDDIMLSQSEKNLFHLLVVFICDWIYCDKFPSHHVFIYCVYKRSGANHSPNSHDTTVPSSLPL